MATVNYGMGQYRYNPTFKYIDKAQVFDGNEPKNTRFTHKNIEYFNNNTGGINYQDVLLTFDPPTGTTDTSNYIQYGNTYYVELEIPQHRQYQMTINLKLCAGDGDTVNTNRFQNIKQLIVPPTPRSDDFLNNVILFEDPTLYHQEEDGKWVLNNDIDEDYPIMKASVMYSKTHFFNDVESLNNKLQDLSIHEVYCTKNNSYYWYIILNDNNEKEAVQLINNHFDDSQKLSQNWRLNEDEKEGKINFGMPTTITYKFAFSPKYNLSEGFPYLLLETERSGIESHTLQYTSNGIDFNGTCLNLEKVKATIYTVSNLLSNGSSGLAQIQSGTNQVIHIGVWGHPEQILTINGEEIKIGRTGFYEIKDYEISSLGVVVTDPSKDRFTIDYEYKIIT